MASRNFALYGGILLLAMGILSFIMPGDMSFLPALKLNTSYGLFLGLFPMNIINKLVVSLVGISGIVIANKDSMSAWVNYNWFVFFAMGVLAILGMFEQTNTLGGYYPLFDGVIGVNGLFAIAAGLCAYASSRTVTYKTHHHA